MLKKFRPKTPATRQLVLLKHEVLTRPYSGNRRVVKPLKSLLIPKKRTSGRDNLGHLTCRHRGGGHKRRYRIVDFVRDKEEIAAKVASIEYDPNRSSYIALLYYVDGEKRYIIAPEGLKEGDKVLTTIKSLFQIGNCLKLKDMPIGAQIHNLEIVPGKGGKLIRSAGLSAQLMARSGGFATVRLPSGEIRLIHEQCRATLGVVSNSEHNLRVEGKAGRIRWQGIRPTVRGIAMNPVDHPLGGGEGRGKGNIPQTPWAEYTKGKRTKRVRKRRNFILKDRRRKK